MKTLEEIKKDLAEGKVELTAHSIKRIVQRNISEKEIQEAALSALLIEDYPEDKYYSSCLLLGFTEKNRPLDVHVSRMPGDCARLITIYEPNSSEWVDNYSKRK
jgi:hypothetical protein